MEKAIKKDSPCESLKKACAEACHQTEMVKHPLHLKGDTLFALTNLFRRMK